MNVMTPVSTQSRDTIYDAPSIAATPGVAHPKLLSVEDAKALKVGQMRDMFSTYINPGQLHFMKLLGFDKIKVISGCSGQ